MHQAHALYHRLGTLEAAGRVMHLTRERVRQLLAKGSALGLFEYRPREYPFVAREKILEDYQRHLSLTGTAKANDISLPYLRKLLTAYAIKQKNLLSIARQGRKDRCVTQYRRLMERLGHHPSTTELQNTAAGHSLHARINRLWGSIDGFREELDIPSPPKGNPRFTEDTFAWKEHQRRLAFVVRMQQLDDVRDVLTKNGSQTLASIAAAFGMNINRARGLLARLLAGGEVEREGAGSHVRYKLRGH